MRGRLTATVLAAGTLAAPAPVAAHSLTSAQIRSASKSAAAALKRQTRASSASVKSCRRSGPHLSRCEIDLRYDSGASRCTVKVDVRLVGRRVRWSPGRTTCY